MADKVFKRNNYYPSKLLTADSFTLEQNYFIDKHEFINNQLYCGGVLRGLQASSSKDGKSVVVSPGFAIDYKGREIIVSDEVTIPLSAGAGDIKKGFIYLYLEYDWLYSDNTFAPLLDRGQQEKYDTVTDFYKFKWSGDITDEFSEMDKLSGDDLYWNRGLLYRDNDFIITQSVPLYARPNRYFEFKVDVFRISDSTAPLTFSYEMTAPNISADEKTAKIDVIFSDNNHIISKEYNLTFSALAKETLSETETLSITEKSFKVTIGGITSTPAPAASAWRIKRTETDITRLLRDLYLGGRSTEDFRLYLAKVYLTESGTVRDIKNVPFGQYLDSWRLGGVLRGVLYSLTTGRETLTEAAVMRLIDQCKAENRIFALQMLEVLKMQPQMSSGQLTVTQFNRLTYGAARNILLQKIPSAPRDEKFRLIDLLHICNRRGDNDTVTESELLSLKPNANTFEIKNINHGLGPGRAEISCGVESGGVISGIIGNIELRAILNETTGTFTIAGRVTGEFTADSLTVVWHASKKTISDALYIVPQAAGAKAGEPVTLLCFSGGADVTKAPDCKWSADPGTSINAGVFTASAAGSYSVTAKYEGNEASSLIIVV